MKIFVCKVLGTKTSQLGLGKKNNKKLYLLKVLYNPKSRIMLQVGASHREDGHKNRDKKWM